MKKTILISFFLVAGLFNIALGQAKGELAKPGVVLSNKAGWHKIGTTAAETNTDSDAVALYGADKFKALHVKATDHGVHIKSMRVYYSDGTAALLDVNSNLKAGETSKDVSIDSSKPVKKVTYVYNASANKNNEKSHVELYGLK